MPFENYIKYLLATTLDPRDTIVKLSSIGISTSREEVESIQKGLMLPPVFSKLKEGKEVDEKFILEIAKVNGFGELMCYKLTEKPKALKGTLEMMKNEELRVVPLILYLKGEDLIGDCIRELGFEFSDDSIELLLNQFFSVKEGDFFEWKKRLPESVAHFLEEPLNYFKYYIGINPRKDYIQMLDEMMQMSFYKFKESVEITTKDNVSIAKKFADIVMKSGERIKKYGGDNKKSFLDDVILEFENADMKFRGAEDVSDEEQQKITLM